MASRRAVRRWWDKQPLLLALGFAALGVVAERLGGFRSTAALIDLTVGWTLAACGIVAWWRRPRSRTGLLLMFAGLAWFVGTLEGSSFATLAIVGSVMLTLHRAPLMHAIVAHPIGKLTDLASRLVVAAAYAYALIAPLARNDVATIAMCAALLVTVLAKSIRSTVTRRGPGRAALIAATAFSIPLLAGSIGRLVGAGQGFEEIVVALYPLGMTLPAILLTTDLLRGHRDAEMQRLVLDLGDPPPAGIRGRIADALGDPSLQLAFWLPEQGAYVDEDGQTIELPEEDSGRRVTVLERSGKRVGALVLDVAALDDPSSIDDIAAAAQFAISNVRLRAEIAGRLSDLEASRQRIIATTDAERRRMQQELRTRIGPELGDLERLLERASARSLERDGTASAGLGQASEQLAAAERELNRLAAGMYPTALAEHALERALASIASGSAVPIDLTFDLPRLEPAVEAALYFACSEAMVNVHKHARASRARVELRMEGEAAVAVVTDDGVGGAVPGPGSGLSGLLERLEEAGGELSIESPPGGGTRITVTFPATARISIAPQSSGAVSGPGARA